MVKCLGIPANACGGEYGQVQAPAGPRRRLKGGNTGGIPRMSQAPITDAAGDRDSQGHTPCVINGVLPLDAFTHYETAAGPSGFHSLGPVINRQGPAAEGVRLRAKGQPVEACG
eukprot:3496999-Pyramimonas_sp.AAC.2